MSKNISVKDVLAVVDGAPASLTGVDQAVAYAGLHGATLTIIVVTENLAWAAAIDPMAYANAMEASNTQRKEHVMAVRERVAGAAVHVEVHNAGEPGFGLTACEYLADRKIVLTGADNWSMEAFDSGGIGERGSYLECHIELQTKHGIWNIENMDFSQLIEDKVYEFLFVWAPLKIKGGTGSPANPVAIY
jgi:kynurenine formamidase